MVEENNHIVCDFSVLARRERIHVLVFTKKVLNIAERLVTEMDRKENLEGMETLHSEAKQQKQKVSLITKNRWSLM